MAAIRTPLPKSHSSLRRLGEQLVWLLIALLVMRVWYVEGLVLSCRVTTGSMAETLLGLHRNVVCEDCGFPFVCGSDADQVPPRAVCPNCGYDHNDLEGRPDLSGDGLLIHKTFYRLRPPRRWEVIALRHPRWASHAQIKRVVGLPGDKIQIRQGDVFIDGHILRKPLRLQRAMAILVHDTNFQPTQKPVPPSRWQHGPDSRWGFADGGFARPVTEDKDTIDWLEYRHWRRVAVLLRGLDESKTHEGPITDVCGYNQTQPRREEEVRGVTDLMLSLTLLDTAGEGKLLIRAFDGSEEFLVKIDPGRNRYEVLQNNLPIPSAVGPLPRRSDRLGIEVSVFDRQFILAFDGDAVVTRPYDPSQPDRQPISRPLAIGSQGLEVKIRDLRVYRDVYYTHPIGVRARRALDEPAELADDEYFVLGDNSPISEDSRTWPDEAKVTERLLTGKPLAVHFPVRRIDWGGWKIQVPDLARIRYIR